MQAVILAAGKGTRMGVLTESTPKPMLLVRGRPVLEHIMDALPRECTEVILIVGHLHEKIRAHFGDMYQGKKLRYVEQGELNGTGGALFKAEPYLTDTFLVMNGDDICRAEDVLRCAQSPDWALLVQNVPEVGSAGKVILTPEGTVADILEKEVHGGGPGIANTANFFRLDTRIFTYAPVYRPGSTTEFGLPQTVVQAVHDIPLHPIEAGSIIRLTAPEDIEKAERELESGVLA